MKPITPAEDMALDAAEHARHTAPDVTKANAEATARIVEWMTRDVGTEVWTACGCKSRDGYVCNRKSGHLGQHCRFDRDAIGGDRNVWWRDAK